MSEAAIVAHTRISGIDGKRDRNYGVVVTDKSTPLTVMNNTPFILFMARHYRGFFCE